MVNTIALIHRLESTVQDKTHSPKKPEEIRRSNKHIPRRSPEISATLALQPSIGSRRRSNTWILEDICQENGDQHRINPKGTSEILEDSIPGILEGIVTPSSPVDRKQESTLFSDHLCYSPF